MTTQYEGLDFWSETIDHVTDDDTRDASAYAISAIGLADRTRWLKNHHLSKDDGGTVTGDVILNNLSVLGEAGFSSFGKMFMYGRKAWYRTRVNLTDANQSVGVDQADRFNLTALNAAPRVLTLKSTIVIPFNGETLTFFWNPGTAGGGGTQYTFQREDSTVIATFVGALVAKTGAVYAEFEYASGIGWRLGVHSGTQNEYTPSPDTWTQYGVIAGAGA